MFRVGRSRSLPGLLLLCACASAPLGDDWSQLDPGARDARAVEVLRELFAHQADGAGRAVDGLEVLSADPEAISWRTEEGATRRLRWLDVQAVEHQVLRELPARPETLYLELRPGSPSADALASDQRTLLSVSGIAPTLVLSQRPARARERFVAALEHLRGRGLAQPVAPAPAAVAAVASPAPARPSSGPADPLSEAEALLRKLDEWQREGLITPEEHARKRREVLDGLPTGAPRAGGD